MSSAVRPLGVVCAAAFFCYLTLGISLGTIPVYVHQTLGFGDVVVGLAVAAQSLGTILTRPFAGTLIDTRGAKLSLIAGCVAMIAGGAAYLFALSSPALPAVSLSVLFASRLALGLGESLSITGALAWGIARIGHQRSGAVMVWVGIALYGAIGVGAPLGALLVHYYGILAAGLVATLAPACALAAIVGIAAMPIEHGPRVHFFAIVGRIAPSGIALALSSLTYSGLGAFVTLLFATHGWTGATYTLTVFAAAYIGARLLFGHLPDRLGGTRVALAALAAECIGQALIWLAATPLAVFAGALCAGAGYSMAFPALGVEAAKRVPPQSRGAAMGAYVAFFDLGFGLSGPLNGLVAASFGYPAVYLAGVIAAALAGVVVVLTLGRRYQPAQNV